MEIVLSGENRYDQYDNFFFKDKGGKEHKVGVKRKNQQELIDLVENNPGRAVKFAFDSYKEIDYIVGIELLELKVDEAKITEQQVAPKITAYAPKPTAYARLGDGKPSIAPQELGMWWKELGNRIGDGSIDKDFPKSAVKIKGQYYKQMETITGITFKED